LKPARKAPAALFAVESEPTKQLEEGVKPHDQANKEPGATRPAIFGSSNFVLPHALAIIQALSRCQLYLLAETKFVPERYTFLNRAVAPVLA
jgi:hypothetical protein